MANTGKWIAGTNPAGTPLTVLSTDLNALGSATSSAASAEIANQTNLDLYADIEVYLASLNIAAAGAYVTLYVLIAIDGTNYPVATGAFLRNQPTHVLATLPFHIANDAQRVTVRNVLLPPCKFKIVLDNQLGVALAASGSTVKLINSNLNLNG